MGKTGAGYTVVRADGQEKTYSGFVYEHRLVAERKIGRPLNPGEVVHHIDHKRSNNDPDNLIIFASGADHRRYHSYGEYCYKAYIDDEGIAHCPHQEYKYIMIPDSPLIQKSAITLNRDELKNRIRNESFSKIGADFGVTRSAVKRRCISFDLPHSERVIKTISDEDWENI